MTSAASNRWEHRTVVHEVDPRSKDPAEGLHQKELGAVLDEHGQGGWELVSTVPIAAGSSFNMNSQTRSLVLFFKRPSG